MVSKQEEQIKYSLSFKQPSHYTLYQRVFSLSKFRNISTFVCIPQYMLQQYRNKKSYVAYVFSLTFYWILENIKMRAKLENHLFFSALTVKTELILLYFLFLDRVYPCNIFCCSGNRFVDQAGPELTKVCLFLPCFW